MVKISGMSCEEADLFFISTVNIRKLLIYTYIFIIIYLDFLNNYSEFILN